MKKLRVLVGNNTKVLMKHALGKVGDSLSDFNLENIVIVPDRLSLITEEEIFNILNIDVYFNLSVMGISKFVKMIIEDTGLNCLECSALASKMLVLKAIQNVSADFKCFSKNYTLGFVDEMYAKIEQIKSSNVSIDDLLDENASEGTKLKFEDIKLIYNEYEKLRAGKLDSGAIMELFNSASISSEYLKNCNVFFIGFDSMTKQGIEVLKNVTKNAHSTLVSVVEPDGQDNDRIYDRTFYKSIYSLGQSGEIECEYTWLKTPLPNASADVTLRNLFSRNKVFDDNGYFQINRASTINDEIENCVKSLNYQLKTKDIKFNDIVI